jgi:hypothetical protein
MKISRDDYRDGLPNRLAGSVAEDVLGALVPGANDAVSRITATSISADEALLLRRRFTQFRASTQQRLLRPSPPEYPLAGVVTAACRDPASVCGREIRGYGSRDKYLI